VVVVAATFFIFLREGVEASMIIAILLAYLDKTGQRRYFRDVLAGVAAAGVLIAGGGTAAYLLLKSYAGSRTQTIFETVTYLVAAVVLTYMTFWMRNHARTIGADLRSRADAAVGREGLETMVFTLAIVFASSGRGALAGGAGGLVVALAIAAAIYRFGRRVDLGRFFTVVGALLMVFAAGLLADAVQNLQELGWVKVLTGVLWNTSGALSEDSTGGDILHSFFGYADQPTVLQAVVYLLYLAAAVYAFLRLGRPRACPEQTKSRVAVGASTPAPSGRSGAAAV
jgi:high-affinity iron transporter